MEICTSGVFRGTLDSSGTPWKELWVNGVHHVTLNPTEISWIHHWIVQWFCAPDTDIFTSLFCL